MDGNKKTNSEAPETKKNAAAENADKLTDEELEDAAGGAVYTTQVIGKKFVDM